MGDSHVMEQRTCGVWSNPGFFPAIKRWNMPQILNEFDDVPTKTPSISCFISIHGYYHDLNPLISIYIIIYLYFWWISGHVNTGYTPRFVVVHLPLCHDLQELEALDPPDGKSG